MLGHLQSMLGEIYGVDTPYDVYDFLITDSAVVRALEGEGVGRDIDEKLLICEQEEGAEVSLFLSGELLARLRADDPRVGLHSENLGDFWTVLEGISHFLYYMWNAERENPITLMEMELQAEVDKFVTTARLLEAQGVVLPQRLHQWLFELPRFDHNLSEQELDRYHQANRYAGKYCIRIARQLSGRATQNDLTSELRHFYRLSQPGKIQHIDASYDSLP
jgi:hypothetical protein